MLQKIENMTCAELKANRDALAAEAEKQPAKELAHRYIQARTDAKLRDERMATMGQEFAKLNVALLASEQREAKLAAQIKALMVQIVDLNAALGRKSDKERIRELELQIKEMGKV